MKKLKIYLFVLFVSFLTIQLYGQIDSVNTNLSLSGEVVKKLDNKDTVEIIKYRDKIVMKRKWPRKFMQRLSHLQLALQYGYL